MLDLMQQRAAEWYSNPCLTLAGPGAGKTTVLVNCVLNLTSKHNIDPSQILVITFTKYAASQMRERYIKLSGDSLVNFATFHSVFYHILLREKYLMDSRILNYKLRREIFSEIGKACHLDFDSDLFIEETVKEISYIQNTKTTLDEYESELFERDDFIRIFHEYSKIKRDNNFIDFDDMLILAYEMFSANKSILERWQKRFSHILIDEAQDMNDVSYSIIKMLSATGNIFLVGDDDQSIYGFRGANPKILFSFQEDFPNCKTITLNRNYRSAKEIVNKSLNLIGNNSVRFEKNVTPFCENDGNVDFIMLRTRNHQTQYVVDCIKNVLKNTDETIGILARKRVCFKDISKVLKNDGLYVMESKSHQSFGEHFIVKDIMSYIRVANGCKFRSDYLRIINRPNRFVARQYLSDEEITLKNIANSLEEKPWIKDRIFKLENDLCKIKTMRPFAAYMYIRKTIGYDGFLSDYRESYNCAEDEFVDILNRIGQIAANSITHTDFLTKLRESKNDDIHDESSVERRLSMHTFHGSKGLEFDNVIIIDANDGITPSKKAVNSEMMEEERRMFYVAVTRARTKLKICCVKYNGTDLLVPSRFIGEMNYDSFSINEEK